MAFNPIDMGLGALLAFLVQRLKAIWQAPQKVTEQSERLDKAYSAMMMTQQNINHVDQSLTQNLHGNAEFIMRLNEQMAEMNGRLDRQDDAIERLQDAAVNRQPAEPVGWGGFSRPSSCQPDGRHQRPLAGGKRLALLLLIALEQVPVSIGLHGERAMAHANLGFLEA